MVLWKTGIEDVMQDHLGFDGVSVQLQLQVFEHAEVAKEAVEQHVQLLDLGLGVRVNL